MGLPRFLSYGLTDFFDLCLQGKKAKVLKRKQDTFQNILCGGKIILQDVECMASLVAQKRPKFVKIRDFTGV